MSQENVEIAKRSVEIYNRRDVDAFFAEVATPDLEWWPALVRALEGVGPGHSPHSQAEREKRGARSQRSLRLSQSARPPS